MENVLLNMIHRIMLLELVTSGSIIDMLIYYHYWPCDWDNEHFKRSHVENMIAPRHIGCTSKCSGRSSDWSLSSMCFCLTAKQKEQLLPCFQVQLAYLQFEFANRDYEIINHRLMQITNLRNNF